jgi:hypothetical protein
MSWRRCMSGCTCRRRRLLRARCSWGCERTRWAWRQGAASTRTPSAALLVRACAWQGMPRCAPTARALALALALTMHPPWCRPPHPTPCMHARSCACWACRSLSWSAPSTPPSARCPTSCMWTRILRPSRPTCSRCVCVCLLVCLCMLVAGCRESHVTTPTMPSTPTHTHLHMHMHALRAHALPTPTINACRAFTGAAAVERAG